MHSTVNLSALLFTGFTEWKKGKKKSYVHWSSKIEKLPTSGWKFAVFLKVQCVWKKKKISSWMNMTFTFPAAFRRKQITINNQLINVVVYLKYHKIFASFHLKYEEFQLNFATVIFYRTVVHVWLSIDFYDHISSSYCTFTMPGEGIMPTFGLYFLFISMFPKTVWRLLVDVLIIDHKTISYEMFDSTE